MEIGSQFPEQPPPFSRTQETETLPLRAAGCRASDDAPVKQLRGGWCSPAMENILVVALLVLAVCGLARRRIMPHLGDVVSFWSHRDGHALVSAQPIHSSAGEARAPQPVDVGSTVATNWPALRLSAVIVGADGRSCARINNHLVTTGSVVSGAVVVAISPQSVTLERRHERRSIMLAKPQAL